jgi:hypothetical protein
LQDWFIVWGMESQTFLLKSLMITQAQPNSGKYLVLALQKMKTIVKLCKTNVSWFCRTRVSENYYLIVDVFLPIQDANEFTTNNIDQDDCIHFIGNEFEDQGRVTAILGMGRSKLEKSVKEFDKDDYAFFDKYFGDLDKYFAIQVNKKGEINICFIGGEFRFENMEYQITNF